MLTRKICTACRLGKCISVGMSPDLIRKEDLAVTKRKSTTPKTEEFTLTVRRNQNIFLQHTGIYDESNS